VISRQIVAYFFKVNDLRKIQKLPSMKTEFPNVDSYIASYPEDLRILLEQVRSTIRKTAPGAEELISYGMPGYKTNGRVLVYFAGFKSHIGFYATPTGHEAFKAELSKYKQGKGSVQFPINQPMPLDLIRQMVEFRVHENETMPKKK
jgi:uncharacterized protein YdhG (YjbR/CyaY superfamily)